MAWRLGSGRSGNAKEVGALQASPQVDDEGHVETCECLACGQPVLLAEVGRVTVALDVREILSPLMGCQDCGGVQPLYGVCGSCGGTGVIGESAPRRVVAVDADGRARCWTKGMRRYAGEALHRRHGCAA